MIQGWNGWKGRLFEPRTASIYPVKKPKKARGPSMATSTSGLPLEPMAQVKRSAG